MIWICWAFFSGLNEDIGKTGAGLSQPKQIVRIEKASIWIDDGIIFAVPDAGSHFVLQDARDSLKVSLDIYPGYAVPMCVDISKMASATMEARAFFSSEEYHKAQNALALIVNSRVSKTIANLYLKVNKPFRPTKIFNDRLSALKWLRMFKMSPRQMKQELNMSRDL